MCYERKALTKCLKRNQHHWPTVECGVRRWGVWWEEVGVWREEGYVIEGDGMCDGRRLEYLTKDMGKEMEVWWEELSVCHEDVGVWLGMW